ncbi:MAG: CotH kinase family protein, partial [Bacteroidales bacterium]|nr:CotH kinase family protein [Bacteroidales bacterium]
DMDKSLIRNCIAFEYSRVLFNAAENYHHEKALNFTPCMKLINVYFTGDYYYSDTRETRHLDGEYLGVYQMSDQMQRKPGRIAVDKLKAIDGSDPDKITGGYIIETDIHEGNHYSPYKRVKMTYKYPEDDDYDPAQYSYITDFIGKAENALYSSNFKDPDNGWRRYMDEKTLADYIILKELVQDMDGYTSTYMYKRRGVDKLFFGPVWDCDKGWDNDKRVPHWQYQPLSSLMIHAGFWMNAGMDNDWFQRVWQDETFRAFVAKRWADKKDELLAVTNRLLDEIPAGAAKAIDANFTVWKFYYQYSSEAKMPAKTYPEEIERIRKLTQQRAALLDKLFNQ